MVIPQSNISNKLLSALSPASFDQFRPHLEWVDLPVKNVLVSADEPAEDIYFLERGLASVVARSGNDDETIEIAHFGREGMSAPHLILMTDLTPNKTFMQLAGSGFVMRSAVFGDFLANDITLRRLFLNYVHTCELQLAHSALANGRYSVYERLARWLLMVHDRLDSDDLPLTHEFLALMLGVRRSGVTEQIHILEGGYAIKATRGNIRILDRERLKDVAGGSYGVPEREYERLIGQQCMR